MVVVHGWLNLLASSVRSADWLRRALGRSWVSFLHRRDPLIEERCVVFDPADQRRAASPLPREAEEVDAGDVGDTASMAQAAVLVEDRKIDPGEVGAVTGRPDDGVHLELAFVLEAHDASRGSGCARLELDSIAAPELAWARTNERVPVLQLAAEPRFDGRREEVGLRQPPEEIAAGDALRQRLLLRTDREDDRVRGRQLLGDLEARVPTADDKYRPLGDTRRLSVPRAMNLPHPRVEVLGELGNERRLEGPGRDDDLVSGERP